MILLKTDFQELHVIKGVESSLVTAFERAGVQNGLGARRLIAISDDVVIVSNMLRQVILALESIFTSISRITAS
jgi:hypothetical protein